MTIFDHNQPKIMKIILNFPLLARLITDYWFLPLAKKMAEK